MRPAYQLALARLFALDRQTVGRQGDGIRRLPPRRLGSVELAADAPTDMAAAVGIEFPGDADAEDRSHGDMRRADWQAHGAGNDDGDGRDRKSNRLTSTH